MGEIKYIMIAEVHQGVRFYRLSTAQVAHFENIKPNNPYIEGSCIPSGEGLLFHNGSCLRFQ